MKKDIQVIRESITKIVALLTQRSIKVTQRGSKAYVSYHARTGAIQLVNIPYLPDDASDLFIAAVQGFLDHEVGHVLFTDVNTLKKAAAGGSRLKNLHNVVEDVYVERKMLDTFPGSAGTLASVREFYLEKVAKVKIAEALAAGDTQRAAGYASVVQFRAWGGQKIAQDFLADNPHIAELTRPMAEKLGPDLIERLKTLKSSADALDLATLYKGKLEEPKSPVPPMSGGDPDDDHDDAESEPSPEADPGPGASSPADEPGDEDGEPSEPAEDPGTKRTEADDSGKERDEVSKTDETTDEAGDRGGDAEAAEGDKDPSEEDEKPGARGEGEKAEKDAAGEDAKGEGEGSAAGDGDEEGEGEGASAAGSEGGDTDSDTPALTDSGDLAGDEQDDEPAPPMPEGGAPDDHEYDPTAEHDKPAPEKADPETPHAPEPEEGEDPASLFDEERDFDEDMSKALTDEAIKEIGESDYQIFSTDWDETGDAPMAHNPASIEKMVDKTQHMVAGIQKGLERAMAAKARKAWNPGQRRGRIAPGALFRTATGDDRVFRSRYETQAKETAVSLLIDCSGSMQSGDRIGTAGLAAFALSSTLERLKIKHEVIGFTTRISRPMMQAIDSEGMGLSYSRLEALYMPVFKSFGERLTVDAKSRMAHLTEHPGWLRENVDGECVQIAAHRLRQQRAERHVLIVLSDGSPACSGDYGALVNHLKKVTTSIDSTKAVEVIGVGIQTSSVKHFYSKNVVLDHLSSLPTTVVGELAKVLLRD